jgi:hypothetical protein
MTTEPKEHYSGMHIPRDLESWAALERQVLLEKDVNQETVTQPSQTKQTVVTISSLLDKLQLPR